MTNEYLIPACSGERIEVEEGQKITIVDIEGGQVVDFFAEVSGNHSEFLSSGVTMDVNESLKLHVGDKIYTNQYREMFKIISDDVREHDLIHPCCRSDMYEFFYQNGEEHPNCFDNINNALGTDHKILNPINFFMYTKYNVDGSFTVEEPLSKAGDTIVLKALMDVNLGVAACSVSESKCNSGKTSPIKILVE